jgi:hypothetical protein
LKIEKIVYDGVEIDYTGHYKNNGINLLQIGTGTG